MSSTIIDEAADRWFLSHPKSDMVQTIRALTKEPIYGDAPENHGHNISATPFPDYTTLFQSLCLRGV